MKILEREKISSMSYSTSAISTMSTTSTTSFDRTTALIGYLSRRYPERFQPLKQSEESVQREELERILSEDAPLSLRLNIANVVERSYQDINNNLRTYTSENIGRPISKKDENGNSLVSSEVIIKSLRKLVPTGDPTIDFIIEVDCELDRCGQQYQKMVDTYDTMLSLYRKHELGELPTTIVPPKPVIEDETSLKYPLLDFYEGEPPNNIRYKYQNKWIPLPYEVLSYLKQLPANLIGGTKYDRVSVHVPSLGRTKRYMFPNTPSHYDLIEKSFELNEDPTTPFFRKFYLDDEIDENGNPVLVYRASFNFAKEIRF
jgi:hypothetical protein